MLFKLIDDDAKTQDGSNNTQTTQELGASLQDQLKQLPLIELATAQVIPDPDQPRKHFDDESLLDLAQSIEENGLLQPIVVQPADDQGHYKIIMGERRWRAHDFAGKATIPAIVRPAADSTVLALQIIENNQREDISPLEEARALQRLVDISGNKKDVAQALGRSPSWLSKRLALLKTPETVQAFADQLDVKDINTLNGLSKLYKDAPETAESLMRDIREKGAEGGLRSRVEQARLELQEPRKTRLAESGQPSEPDHALQTGDTGLNASGAKPHRPETEHVIPVTDQTSSGSSPSADEALSNKHESELDRQLWLMQQLKLAPLNTLPGIEQLSMSFSEMEQHFRRYLQQAERSDDLPAQWQRFIQQLTAQV